MENVYEIQPFDLNLIGSQSNSSIKIKVKGFWSYDHMSLWIRRGYGTAPVWDVTLSISSGGRDTSEVASDLDAYENHATALKAAIELGRFIEANTDVLEAAYQARRQEIRAEFEAERAAKELAVSADPAVGMGHAKAIVAKMHADVKANYSKYGFVSTVLVYERGTDIVRKLIAYRSNLNIVFLYNNCKVSKAEAEAYVAKSSHRTTFETEEAVAQ